MTFYSYVTKRKKKKKKSSIYKEGQQSIVIFNYSRKNIYIFPVCVCMCVYNREIWKLASFNLKRLKKKKKGKKRHTTDGGREMKLREVEDQLTS